jgi:hypothetical protein
MRYPEFPPDQSIVRNKGEGRSRMSYEEFLNEHVWTDPKWRQDAEFAKARQRLVKQFDAAFSKGARGVGLSDKDFEKWEPIAALRGPFQIPAENVRAVSVFTDAAILASTDEPLWAAEGTNGKAVSLPSTQAATALPPAVEEPPS